MKRSSFITAFILCLLFTFPALAQGPESSPKLAKEKGFNALKIGAKLSAVKSLLQKDTIPKKDSWDNSGMSGITEVYLVDLAKPGYQTFAGKSIARIEVYISPYFSDDEMPIVWEVKIFFKKVSATDCNDFFARLLGIYGGAYPVIDMPREGDTTITWYSENVLMNAASYTGSYEAPKDDYFMVSFTSAKGG